MIRSIIFSFIVVLVLVQPCSAALPALGGWGRVPDVRMTVKQAHEALACYQKLKEGLRCDSSDSKPQKSNTSKGGR